MRSRRAKDHEAIGDYLSRRRRRGCDTILASDGRAAVVTARAKRPDRMPLDMTVPIKDGGTAAHEIRAAGRTDGHPTSIDCSPLIARIEALRVDAPTPA